MATKNQTALFRKYREALRNVRPFGGGSSGVGGGRGGAIELVEAPLVVSGTKGYYAISMEEDAELERAGASMGLPPAWVDISDEVSSQMHKAKTKMAELAKAHSRALMPSFDDSSGQQQNIEILTQEITRHLKKGEQKLQKLAGGQGSREDVNLRKNVQRSLATDLQSLSMDFRKLQKGYLNKLRQQQEGQSGADLGMGFSQQRERSDEDDDMDMGFSSSQLSQVKQNEVISAEREREITQIVESVNDLAQIMKDLSVLVIDQGTIVDRIDYNITNVSASVEQGVKELVKAEQTQKKGGTVMCIMVLIALCAFMLFVYVLKKLLGF